MSEVDPFEHVARVIQLSEGFCLIMLVGSAEDEWPGLRRVQRALGPGYTVRWHDVGRDGTDLMPSVALGGHRLVLFVHGMDETDVERWRGMAERLNMGRDALTRLPVSLVLWLPGETAGPFIASGPDLFALRSVLGRVPSHGAVSELGRLVEPTPLESLPASRPRRVIERSRRLVPGDELAGSYVIWSLLQAGTFSYVYRAVEVRDPRRLAVIKVLHPAVEQLEKHRTWLAEQCAMMRAVGPSVFPEMLWCDRRFLGFTFMVSAFIDEHRTWYTAQGEEVMEHLASTLGRLHEAGFIHGRVCPANVLVDRRDVRGVRLIDPAPPGLVIPSRPDGRQYIDGPAYIAPEITLERPPIDRRADIFSLGMLWALVLHGRPLPARAGWQPASFIETLPCNGPLRRVLLRATSIDPADRYDSVAAFTDALTEARRIR